MNQKLGVDTPEGTVYPMTFLSDYELGQKMLAEMEKTYGCDDCKYLSGHRCKLWQVKVVDPRDSHCESLTRA